MTPDLPVELWLHLLDLLPKSYLRKMMGINRTLFELAMNEVYQEIRFIEDGRDMTRIFHQLRYTHPSPDLNIHVTNVASNSDTLTFLTAFDAYIFDQDFSRKLISSHRNRNYGRG
jgi:hypothetical protein